MIKPKVIPEKKYDRLGIDSFGPDSTMSETKSILTGGCYCGDVRYQCEGPPLMRGQNYCLTCQKISGGAGNLFIAVDAQGFQFTQGMPRAYNKGDRSWSPTQHFCQVCGVHLTARSDRAPGAMLIKVGTRSTIPPSSRDLNW